MPRRQTTRGFAKGAQRRRPNAQPTFNGLEGRSLLQCTQARNCGTKEVQQQKADVLVVEQLAVAGPITLGANVLESRQQGQQRVEILQAFNVTRLQGSPAWSGHRCLHAIPEVLRVRMKASRNIMPINSRKFRAEQYWGPVAGGAIGTSGMPLTASGRERPPDSDACNSAEKLGVIEASYASAIIGVLSPVSSHC